MMKQKPSERFWPGLQENITRRSKFSIGQYLRAENIKDNFLTSFRFIELHPHAKCPPDIRTFKGFMEFVSIRKKGRIDERPTVDTMDYFRRTFVTAMSSIRGHEIGDSVVATIREARLSFAPIFYP